MFQRHGNNHVSPLADYNIQREAVVYMYSELDEKVPTDEDIPTDDGGDNVGNVENVVKNEVASKNNPQTGDGIVGYIAMLVMSILGLVVEGSDLERESKVDKFRFVLG